MVPWALARAEIRRRWRGAAAVGLVLGLGFAAVLAAAAGGRRTATAFPRMLAASRATALLVSSGNVDQVARHQFYRRVAALDGVGRMGLLAGIGLIPTRVPKGSGTEMESCANLSLDGVFGYDLDRPNVLQGRMPDPGRSDEILVTKSYAETFGVGVGDRLDLVLYNGDGAPAAGEVTAADGPVVRATIAGIGALTTQIVPVSDLEAAPTILAPPGLGKRYAPGQERWCYDAAAIALKPGADAGRVVADINRISRPGDDAFIQDRTGTYADVRRAIQPQVTTLWLFAAVAALATLLVVAQLLGRQLRQSTAAATPVWRALGVTRSQARLLVAAPSMVTALVGGAVALVGAVLVSGRFPIGPARLAETDRGTEVHAWVLVGGTALVGAAAVAMGGVVGFSATRAGTRPSRLGWLAWLGGGASQPSVLVGIHLATGSRRGEAAVPVRSAAAGAALAVAAVVATVTFAGGLEDLVSDPTRYGRDWDVMVDGGFGPAPVEDVLEELGRDPAVEAVAGGRYGEVAIDATKVPAIGLTDLKGTTFPAIIDGRAPERGDEIVLGKRSLRDLRRSVGDTVTVDLGTGPREMAIVGTAAFPRLNQGSFKTLGLGVGAVVRTGVLPPFEWVPPPEFDPGGFVGPGGEMFEFVTVRARRGATPEARRDMVATARTIGDANLQVVRTEQRPIAIDNYAAVRSTPVVLAVLLGSMAAATLAHLVVSVVRRRRRDLALCIALGMRRAQVWRAVVVQALLVANVAMLVGLPLGLAAGRLAWGRFAADLGVVNTLRLPFGPLALVVPVVELAAVAVALVPAMVAARARPALALRTE